MGKFYIGHVSYNGSEYYGWQKQKDVPTIQETIFDCLRGLYPLGRIDVKATSRTDRHVNALAQVVKFLIPRREDADIVLEKVNGALPSNIRFTQLERINKSFKVTYLSKYKEYVYFLSTKSVPFDFVGEIPESINIDSMREAAKLFIGKNDFTYFQYRADVKSDFVRNVLDCKLIPAKEIFPDCFKDHEEVFVFFVRGEGFLKQMVRLMVGTLINVGLERISLETLEKALKGDSERRPGFIAPGTGLFLKHIEFPEVFSGDQLRHVVDQENYKNEFPQFELWQGNSPQSFKIEIKEENS